MFSHGPESYSLQLVAYAALSCYLSSSPTQLSCRQHVPPQIGSVGLAAKLHRWHRTARFEGSPCWLVLRIKILSCSRRGPSYGHSPESIGLQTDGNSNPRHILAQGRTAPRFDSFYPPKCPHTD